MDTKSARKRQQTDQEKWQNQQEEYEPEPYFDQSD